MEEISRRKWHEIPSFFLASYPGSLPLPPSLILFLPRSRCISYRRGHFLPDTMAHGEYRPIISHARGSTRVRGSFAFQWGPHGSGPGPVVRFRVAAKATASVCSSRAPGNCRRKERFAKASLVKSTRKLQKRRRLDHAVDLLVHHGSRVLSDGPALFSTG